ncbi:MAG TPA: fimbria/pilus periplasmic chaperone [Burkholderiales bacterium]
MTQRLAAGSPALRLLLTLAFLASALAVTGRHSRAADFSVSPMSLELERGVRSAEIEVRNLDQQRIRFQVRGTDWGQDESGKNVYSDSHTLIWFPRALELAPGESRIIRVGVRATPAAQEQAYTVFLQEVALEESPSEKPRGAQVRLLLSVAVPVFVPPARPQPGGEVELAELRNGTLTVAIANRGNRRFSYREAAIVGVDADGTGQFTHKIQGRTLLAGSRQQFQVRIPGNVCRQLKELALTLTTSEQAEKKHRLDVAPAACE